MVGRGPGRGRLSELSRTRHVQHVQHVEQQARVWDGKESSQRLAAGKEEKEVADCEVFHFDQCLKRPTKAAQKATQDTGYGNNGGRLKRRR